LIGFVFGFAEQPGIAEKATMHPERIIVTSGPENSETPLNQVTSWVTPNRLFFVRNHFEPPAVRNPEAWELTLEGLVARPARWTLAQLAALPQYSVFATVECAGNGRSFLREKAAGVQWGAGAIGHAEWTGVRLRDLLEPAGVKAGAQEIIFEGADHGVEDGEAMNFSRSLPLAKALDPDTLVALRMNGEALEPNHGAPLRLFVPGWYGVASVKWLRTMRVIDHAYPGFFQTIKYSIDRGSGAGKRRQPLGPGVVKSEILFPRDGDELGVGTIRIGGVAWAGEERVTRIDVSTDGGRTWQAAHLKGIQQRYSWCQWEALWTVTAPGEYALVARAHTETGQAQPFEYDPDNLGYLINVVRPARVRVVASQQSAADFADRGAWAHYMEAFAEENIRRPLDVELALTAGDGI
jgi:DMSO/TMAO reductase YedYZ molybdopterin-dependent catalytic subunit